MAEGGFVSAACGWQSPWFGCQVWAVETRVELLHFAPEGDESLSLGRPVEEQQEGRAW